jgi:hypothetical protein
MEFYESASYTISARLYHGLGLYDFVQVHDVVGGEGDAAEQAVEHCHALAARSSRTSKRTDISG